MTTFQIEPFELTEEFKNCWLAAGRHLSLRVKDTGSFLAKSGTALLP